jgi:hypothetical protein
MVNVAALERTPRPSAMVITCTVAVPAVASKEAGTVATSVVLLISLVVRNVVLFHHIVVGGPKVKLPFTVSVIAVLPWVALFGLMEVSTGGGTLVIVKGPYVTPPKYHVKVWLPVERVE